MKDREKLPQDTQLKALGRAGWKQVPGMAEFLQGPNWTESLEIRDRTLQHNSMFLPGRASGNPNLLGAGLQMLATIPVTGSMIF